MMVYPTKSKKERVPTWKLDAQSTSPPKKLCVMREELEEDDSLIDATKVQRKHKDRVKMVEKAGDIKKNGEELHRSG